MCAFSKHQGGLTRSFASKLTKPKISTGRAVIADVSSARLEGLKDASWSDSSRARNKNSGSAGAMVRRGAVAVAAVEQAMSTTTNRQGWQR